MLLQLKQLKTTGMRQAVTWQMQAGQLWLIYGASGSGKSRLLKALSDLVAREGEALLLGKSVDAMNAHEWRRKVMYFPAETAWWLDKVADHFSVLPKESSLQAVGLTMSLLQQHPDQLSSGEKQRLALLRGLAFQPNVLLLDETSANLDPESTLLVEQLVQDYVKAEANRGAIWISHDVAQRERLACPSYCCSIDDLYENQAG